MLAVRSGGSIVRMGAGANDTRRLNYPPLFDFAVIRTPAPINVISDVMKTGHARPATSGLHSITQTWTEWQRDVVAILRRDFAEALDHISLEDVDWPAWFRFYLEGRSAGGAVDRALERNL